MRETLSQNHPAKLSQIPHPQELSERISIYYIKMLSVGIICYITIDKCESLYVESEEKNKAKMTPDFLGCATG